MLVWLVITAVILLAFLFRRPHCLQDVDHLLAKLKVKRRVLKYSQSKYLILDRFLDRVKAHPHRPFVLFNEETFSWREADALSSRAARVFLRSGLRRGDTAALFLGNEPGFLWLWLGLMKIGCSAAFLNCNIRSKSLLHCFSCSGATALVAAEGELCEETLWKAQCCRRCFIKYDAWLIKVVKMSFFYFII